MYLDYCDHEYRFNIANFKINIQIHVVTVPNGSLIDISLDAKHKDNGLIIKCVSRDFVSV